MIGWPLAILGAIFSALGAPPSGEGTCQQQEDSRSPGSSAMLHRPGLLHHLRTSRSRTPSLDAAATGTVSGSSQPAPPGDAVAPAGALIDVDGLQLTAGTLTDSDPLREPVAVHDGHHYKNTGSGRKLQHLRLAAARPERRHHRTEHRVGQRPPAPAA
ncbi:hypothetical protein HBB16_13640 [Pseudonocardia sp. MCCB 268]|nr:hypothetical protein [Pseudonocardia cytotoxica]